MNGKRVRKLKSIFREKFGRNPQKAEFDLDGRQTGKDEFRRFKKNNK
jgi:hypothetical protein